MKWEYEDIQILKKKCKHVPGSCIICSDSGTGDLRSYYETFSNDGQQENYSDMLTFCFHIQVSDREKRGEICSGCVSRLHDAVLFRKQVEGIREDSPAMQIQLGYLNENSTVNDLEISIDAKQDFWSQDVKSDISIDNSVDKTINNNLKTPKEETSGNSKQLKLKKGLINTCNKNDNNNLENKIAEEKSHISNYCGFTSDECDEAVEFDEFFDEDPLNSGEWNDIKPTKAEQQTLKIQNNNLKDRSDNKKSTNDRNKRIEWYDQNPYPSRNPESEIPTLKRKSTKCPVCEKVFPNHKGLSRHYGTHFPQYLCEICGKIFAWHTTYKAHVAKHRETIYPCTQCKRTYVYKNSLQQHVKMFHNKKKLYSCSECTERFSNSLMRREHLFQKHGVWYDQCICPVCQKKCFTVNRLDRHMRSIHVGEKNVSCPECDILFFSNSCLRKHMPTHSDAKDFHCDLCGKALKTKKSLKEHLKIHLNIRNYKCEICGQTFIQYTSLKVHMYSHHKDVVSSSRPMRKSVKQKMP